MTACAHSSRLRGQWRIGSKRLVCLLVLWEKQIMTQSLGQSSIHYDQSKAERPSNSVYRSMSRPLRILGLAIGRLVLASVNLWYIPVIGQDETHDFRSFRTKHYI